jgi:hypothetical protein
MKTISSLTGIVLVATSGLLVACGEATPEPTQPAVTATAAVTAAPTGTAATTAAPADTAAAAPKPLADLGLKIGKLDSKLLAAATTAKGVEKMKIATNPAGEVTKLSVYHNDASQVPEAVMATLKKKLPGATIKHYESEFYADKGRVFEVEVTTKDKKECELGALPDGKLLYVECALKVDKLPKAIKDAVTKALPNAEIVEAEKKDGDTNEFSVEAKVAGVMHYMHVSPKGAITWHGQRIATYVDIALGGAAAPAGDAKPGNFDPEILTLALKAKGAEKLKIRTNAASEVTKIALYHKDEAAIPEAAKATAASKYPGSKSNSYYETELYSDHGKVFEADLVTADNKKCEVSTLKDGTFLYSECDMKKEDVPKEITEALLKLAPGGEIVEVEKKESPWGNGYSFEVKANGQMHYIKLGPAGEKVWHGVRITTELDVTVP